MTQQQRIYEAMRGGGWFTLAELAHIAHASEAGASARLRDFRKQKCRDRYGAWNVERRRVREGGNLWEYRLVREDRAARQGSLI